MRIIINNLNIHSLREKFGDRKIMQQQYSNVSCELPYSVALTPKKVGTKSTKATGISYTDQ